MKVHELPSGYTSWLECFKLIKENPRLRAAETIAFLRATSRADYFSLKPAAPLKETEIPLDYIKARAFEEILDALPDEYEIKAAVETMRAFLPEHGTTIQTIKKIPTRWKTAS